MSRWETVIGLEVHAQLKTRTKIFCACRSEFGGEPNTRCCPVCLGLPGALPVLNRQVPLMAATLGRALGATIRPHSVMARKNYFYPDLPKGYQISQYERPLCEGGVLEFPDGTGGLRRVGITRIHIEEDAGKSLHRDGRTLVDLNRCGTPLAEIVSEPELRSPQEAHEALLRLRQLLRWLDLCDGNMEEGSLRCDANLSLRPAGSAEMGERTELKNLNSFKAVSAALAYEAARQAAVLEGGGRVERETRLWDPQARVTRTLRGKEASRDYRYFPEPDLPPVLLDEAELPPHPELPLPRLFRFLESYGLGFYEADILTRERATADFFESLVSRLGDARRASRWCLGELMRHANERRCGLHELGLDAERLAELVDLEARGLVSGLAAKSGLDRMLAEGGRASEWMDRLDLAQLSDAEALSALVDAVLAEHPRELERYRGGVDKLMGFFVGQVMERAGGRADPKEVQRLLIRRLGGG